MNKLASREDLESLVRQQNDIIVKLIATQQAFINFICELDCRVGITAGEKAFIEKTRETKQACIDDGSWDQTPPPELYSH